MFFAFAAAALVPAVFVCGALYVYTVAFYADRKCVKMPYIPEGNPGIKIAPERISYLINDISRTAHEDVYIFSRDGLKLCGKYYHFADGAPLDIQFHGYRSLSCRDLCGGFRISRDMGHNILLVDERAHGNSEGHVISFGIKERYDCMDWVNYAVERFGEKQKIILVGVSMGASTVLMASSLALPDNVVGIIADSAYTSPRDIILKVGADRKIPPYLVLPLAKAGAKIFGHFDLCESSALCEVEKCKMPVLFIHGDEDFFVPSYMSRKIYDACASEKRMTILPNSGHCAGYIFNTQRYIKEIRDFSNYVLSRGA